MFTKRRKFNYKLYLTYLLFYQILIINQTLPTCQRSSRRKSCRSFHRWRKWKLWGKTKTFHQPVLPLETFWSRSWLWKFAGRSARCWPLRSGSRTAHFPSRLQAPQRSGLCWAPAVWFSFYFLLITFFL